MRTTFWILALAGLLAGRAGAEGTVTAPGAALEKLADGFVFTEGAASDADGNVYFTDQPTDRILKWSAAEAKLTTYRQPCGRSNGLCFDGKGNLWACADEKNELWRISPEGKITVAVKEFGGKLLNGPNDVWVSPAGGAYFTDPFYKRDYWKRGPIEQECQGVYFLSTDGKLQRVAGDLKQPNGIIGTPDGKRLYVADIGAGKTYAYDIQPDGALANKRLFCSLGSDGMTIDDEENLYLTGRGVTVFDKAGKEVERIPVPEGWTGNVCFGGKERQTLFITAGKGLYAIRMRTRGVGSQ